MNYTEFLEKKIVVAQSYGTDIEASEINPKLLDHQKSIEYKINVPTLFDVI